MIIEGDGATGFHFDIGDFMVIVEEPKVGFGIIIRPHQDGDIILVEVTRRVMMFRDGTDVDRRWEHRRGPSRFREEVRESRGDRLGDVDFTTVGV